ncbi:hypothetical protein [Parabacteroides gordonii]|uniref:hypothetical protein n=1 Tax=Parabacteroides gordonii TaxID=574930 RepID=UPI000EBED282|nr:hypothetical protein [Parabacteroides gordonii]RGP18265.1 hypothetical protein DXB27_02260 [Parabacteroides gordonii]
MDVLDNKHLDEFAEAFNQLYWAGDILMSYSKAEGLKRHSRFNKCTEEEKKEIWKNIIVNKDRIYKYDYKSLNNEVYRNLFKVKDDRIAYIVYVLRRFSEAASYLFTGTKSRFNFQGVACTSFIEKIESYSFNEKLDLVINKKLYNNAIEPCILIYRDGLKRFLSNFDCKCYDFGFDIVEIQEKAGFCIYKRDLEEMKRLKDRGVGSDNLCIDTIKQLNALHKGDATKLSSNIELSQYKYQGHKLLDIYNFCNGEVFNISFGDFVIAVEKADFSKIYNSENLLKNKFAYSISVIKKFVDSVEWYKKAANSIGEEPTSCSKKSVPKDWKDAINAIK